MTYTEQDLRAALGALETDAPDVADTLAGLDRLRHRRTVRRRTVGMVAVAAVTMALAAGALAVPDLVRSNEQPATALSDAFRFRFAVDLPGLRPYSLEVGNGRQTMGFYNDSGPSINLVVFDAGGYDPTEARAGKPVDVNGKRGFYRDDLDRATLAHSDTRFQPPGPLPDPGLAWEYAPNSWAVAVLPGLGLEQVRGKEAEQLLRLARAVRFDQTTPFRVPFTVGYLPAGLGAATLGDYLTKPSGGTNDLQFVTVDLSAAGDRGPTLAIEASTRNPYLPVGEPMVKDGQVQLNLGPFMVYVRSSKEPGRGLSDEEVLKVARSISVAGDWNDRTTWIEAERAIPTS